MTILQGKFCSYVQVSICYIHANVKGGLAKKGLPDLALVGEFVVQNLLSFLLPTFLKLLVQPRNASVPATLMISAKHFLVFPNRHHMNEKKSTGIKFLRTSGL